MTTPRHIPFLPASPWYQQEGRLLVFSLDKVTLYSPAPLDEAMIALVSDAIAGSIQRTPDINPVNLDYWPFGR